MPNPYLGLYFFFFLNDPAPPEFYPFPLPGALPFGRRKRVSRGGQHGVARGRGNLPPPIGHLAAASPANGGAGGDVREGQLRHQEGHHHGLRDLVVNRQQRDGIQRGQPRHGDDRPQPRQAVGHPHQRLRPREEYRGQQRRPDQRKLDSPRPPRGERGDQPQDRHGGGSIPRSEEQTS